MKTGTGFGGGGAGAGTGFAAGAVAGFAGAGVAGLGAGVAVGFAGQSLYVNRATGTVIATMSCWPQPPYAAAHGIDLRAERQAMLAGIVAALAGG